MASVRPRLGTSYLYACYKLPTGEVDAKGKPIFRRVQRSTGLTDPTRALQLALSYERAAILAGEKRFTEQAARNFLAEIRAVSAVSTTGVEATNAFLRRWLKSRASLLAPNTRDRYASVVDQFLAHLGKDRAAAPIGEVGAREVAAFRDAEIEAGKSPTTVNKALGVLALAFDEAAVQHGLEKNPARHLNVKGAARRRQHRRPFTLAQFAALVAADPAHAPAGRSHKDGLWRSTAPEWRTLILVGGYTGARQQEAASLRWEQVELDLGRLTLERTKNADTHWLPIHRTLAAHLRSLGPRPSGPVMPHLARLKRRHLSNTFRRSILPAIGLRQDYAQRTPEKGVGRTLAPYSFHSLRHSLSTWLEAAGVEESMRMKIVGHEDEDVNRGYTHTELALAAAELAKVPDVSVT